MNKPADISLAIAKLETRPEQILEGPLRRLFGGKIEPADLANRLARVPPHLPTGGRECAR
jgi:hypothetical protein